MPFEIITFGNGEILKGIFDAIAMCLNAQTGTLHTPLIRIGSIVALAWAAIYSIWGDFLKAWGKALVPLIFIPPLLFVPSTTVYIKDVVSQYRDKVDHVPYGLAWIAHFISQFGYELTRQVDQVFVGVDDLKYHKAGFLMASNLIQQAKTFRITNENVAENMRQFVCQCIAYEAMLGVKYTVEDLRHSADIWALVSANPSPVRSFMWKPPTSASPPKIITCKQGVTQFNLLWASQLEQAKSVFGAKLFGRSSKIEDAVRSKQALLKYLPLSYGFLTGLSHSADQILKQQMMIHGVVEGIEHKSTALGNAPNFAARRAYLQQRSTYETMGAMASESLMTMKAVLEALVYAAFIFIVPMAILPFGIKIVLSWVQTLLWLQMWAPLYAVLNYIMSMTAQSRSLGMLSSSSSEGVTIASSVGLMNLNADMSALAGFLALSVPFLAIAMVKGAGSLMNITSSIGQVTQGAASQAAGDMVSGNYSFANVSEGNHQMGNISMLSQSRAASLKAGYFQSVDGRADVSTMADGSRLINMGVSNLPVGISVAESWSAQHTATAAQNYQNAFTALKSSGQSWGDSFKKTVNLSDYIGKSQSLSDGVSSGMTAEQSKAIHKTAQLVKEFSDQNNISNSIGSELMAEVSVGGNLFGLVKGSLGLKGSLSHAKNDLLQKAEKFMEDNNFQEAVRQSTQASKSLAHNLSDEDGKKFAMEIAGSYDRGINKRHEASASYTQGESYTRQAAAIQADSAAINANYNQEFVDWLDAQPADNTDGHIGERGAVYILSQNAKNVAGYAAKFMKEKGLTPNLNLNNSDHIKETYQADRSDRTYGVNGGDYNAVEQQGRSRFNTNPGQRGQEFRRDMGQAVDVNNRYIRDNAATINREGTPLKNKVGNLHGEPQQK